MQAVMGRPVQYPWDEWFALGRFVLERGRDYTVRPMVMAQQIRTKVNRMGLLVSIHSDGDGRLDVELRSGRCKLTNAARQARLWRN